MGEAEAILLPHADRLGRPVAEVARDLESYARLLEKWQRVQNLVSRETLRHIWTRHMADSLQVLSLLKPDDTAMMDFGSGGGFPALPLAIALKGTPARFLLSESNGRKVSFLRTVARDLGLAVGVDARRGEEIGPGSVSVPDVITARALASLTQLCALMAPFFAAPTRAILHKGREHVDELREAAAHWSFDVVIHPSTTDPDGVLVELTNLRLKTSR